MDSQDITTDSSVLIGSDSGSDGGSDSGSDGGSDSSSDVDSDVDLGPVLEQLELTNDNLNNIQSQIIVLSDNLHYTNNLLYLDNVIILVILVFCLLYKVIRFFY